MDTTTPLATTDQNTVALPLGQVEGDRDEEAEEIDRLQNVEYDYVEEELCPCIFIEYCEGVPLNPHPEAIREQEALFHEEMMARKDELLSNISSRPSSSETEEEDEDDEEVDAGGIEIEEEMDEDEEDSDEGIDME